MHNVDVESLATAPGVYRLRNPIELTTTASQGGG